MSADFLASDYCYDVEMQRALQRHEAGDARVIPVILRPVRWQGAPFEKLQALPPDGKAITTWPNMDEAFVQVIRGIEVVARALTSHPETPQEPALPRAVLPAPAVQQPGAGQLLFVPTLLTRLWSQWQRRAVVCVLLLALGTAGLWQVGYYKLWRAQVLNNHGVTLALAAQDSQAAQAAQAFQDALWWVPSFSPAHANLGELAIRQSQWDKALEHYKAASQSAGHVIKLYRLGLGKLYAKQRTSGADESATFHLKAAAAAAETTASHAGARLLQNDPVLVCGEAYNALGLLYQDEKKLDHARQAFEQGVECSPRMPQLHHHLGELDLQEQRPTKAREHLDRALMLYREQTPENWQVQVTGQYALAQALLALGQYTQVCERLRALRAYDGRWWLYVAPEDLRQVATEAQCEHPNDPVGEK